MSNFHLPASTGLLAAPLNSSCQVMPPMAASAESLREAANRPPLSVTATTAAARSTRVLRMGDEPPGEEVVNTFNSVYRSIGLSQGRLVPEPPITLFPYSFLNSAGRAVGSQPGNEVCVSSTWYSTPLYLTG